MLKLLIIGLIIGFLLRFILLESEDTSRQTPSLSPGKLDQALTSEEKDQIMQLISYNQSLKAVKLVSQISGANLKDSKAYIDVMEEKYKKKYFEESLSRTDQILPPEVKEKVLELVLRGEKIKAVKLVRETTGLSLKESRDYVDSL